MKLIVIPGTGCPDNKKYASVYRFLEHAASGYGYSSADNSLRWPGHNQPGQNHCGVMTLDGALEVAKKKTEQLENGTENYDFLARSFGCYVALKIAQDLQPRLLRKIILWGPPPYWLVWEMFSRDIEKNSQVAKDKGTTVDSTLFPSIVPLESMLPDVRYQTIVATGDHDPYVPVSYLEYLESIVKKRTSNETRQFVQFKKAVPGAVHEVPEDAHESVKQAYLKALFE